MSTLNEIINNVIIANGELDILSSQITDNLNPRFELRPYQHEALARLQYFWGNKRLNSKPNPHLLFHMATGSGKTIIMASSIIYLYKQGYRNFLFFVNSSNIITKTRDNFLNVASSKHLFSQFIEIDGQQITISDVQNFQSVNSDNINICFTTIQGLHDSLSTPGENKLTMEDFEATKLILISDEAHHINASTRKGETQDEVIEKATWESTIQKIHTSNSANVLLEYTATIDLKNPNILAKYENKLIFDYPLREFRKDGYSKEVKVLQIDSDNAQRALCAVILSQYRLKLFGSSKLNIKPVILFKSKTIKESQEFLEEFDQMINSLTPKQLLEIRNTINNETLHQAFNYFESSQISLENLVLELKSGFGKDRLIEVNSKQESEQKQIAVNTLEDQDNQYRAVFAVDKLNEGWDVLNLFDIVRLYDTRDASSNSAGKTTISEAQLIGRGARYCPFKLDQNTDTDKYKRKFDQELENQMRICEELYYYSSYNPKYIQELTAELKKQGVIANTHRQVTLKLKDSFKETDFFEHGLIWTNKQILNDKSLVTSLEANISNQIYTVSLITGTAQTSTIFSEESKQTTSLTKNTFNISFGDINSNIIQKAINKSSFFSFDNLTKFLPNLKSISEFLTSSNYLSPIKIQIKTTKLNLSDITPDEFLYIAITILSQIKASLTTEQATYYGSKEFEPQRVKDKLQDKTLNFAIEAEGSDSQIGLSQNYSDLQEFSLNLESKDWYAYTDNYGTSEEKYLVKTIDSMIAKLRQKHDQVYLIRNEKVFRIFDFVEGRPFEPDFVLFLRAKDNPEQINYQVFIEPKGGYLAKEDQWKEEFLLALQAESKAQILTQTKQYRVWGMEFYTEKSTKYRFVDTLEKLFVK
jgi:type III restriction enzyme